MKKCLIQADYAKGPIYKNWLVEEYNKKVRLDFKDNPNLKVFYFGDTFDKDSEEDISLAGSNPFAAVLFSEMIGEESRIQRLSDMELILKQYAAKNNELHLIGGVSLDVGLALLTEGPPNKNLNRSLLKEIREKQGYDLPTGPKMLNLTDLKLVNDPESEYGLSFELKPAAKIINAPVLLEDGHSFLLRDIDIETGLPKRTYTGNGSRSFIRGWNGLTRIYVAYKAIHTNIDDLAKSSCTRNRILIVKEK